jgi:hypothetical protein
VGGRIKEVEMGGTCMTYGGYGKCMYKILFGKSEGKKLLLRPGCRWKGNIRMDLREMGGKL